MALHYVGRFATSRAKLANYLKRKLRERGWAGPGEPDVVGLAERLTGLGYVDDRSYALGKARSLLSRGYGGRRVEQALWVAGIDDEAGGEARELAGTEAVEAALRYARRRSLGPFAAAAADEKSRERALAAMVRAGHGFALSRAIIALNPGENPDSEILFNLH